MTPRASTLSSAPTPFGSALPATFVSPTVCTEAYESTARLRRWWALTPTTKFVPNWTLIRTYSDINSHLVGQKYAPASAKRRCKSANCLTVVIYRCCEFALTAVIRGHAVEVGRDTGPGGAPWGATGGQARFGLFDKPLFALLVVSLQSPFVYSRAHSSGRLRLLGPFALRRLGPSLLAVSGSAALSQCKADRRQDTDENPSGARVVAPFSFLPCWHLSVGAVRKGNGRGSRSDYPAFGDQPSRAHHGT